MRSLAKDAPSANQRQATPPVLRQTTGMWWRKNWMWLAPVGGLGAIALVFFGLIALTVVGAFAAMRSSGACKAAVASAIVEPTVIDALSLPIEEGWFVTGTLNPGRDAKLTIPISGPKGSANIHVVASKSSGKWNFSTLVVEIKATRQRVPITEKTTPLSPAPDSNAAKINPPEPLRGE